MSKLGVERHNTRCIRCAWNHAQRCHGGAAGPLCALRQVAFACKMQCAQCSACGSVLLPRAAHHRARSTGAWASDNTRRSSCAPSDAVPAPLCHSGRVAPAACSASGSAVSGDGDGAPGGDREAADVPARLVSRTHRRTLLFVAGAALGSGAARQPAAAQAATASFCLECGGTGIVACTLSSWTTCPSRHAH